MPQQQALKQTNSPFQCMAACREKVIICSNQETIDKRSKKNHPATKQGG
jgi:hypothetical protein